MDKVLMHIIPGAKAVWCDSRIALLIVAAITFSGCWLLGKTASDWWLIYIASACMIINTFYIIFIIYATRLSQRMFHPLILYSLAYILLILASTPTLLMLLCGLDYSLFEILSWYILLEAKQLILPIATLIFISITYWLPVAEIIKIQKRYKHFINLKMKNNGK